MPKPLTLSKQKRFEHDSTCCHFLGSTISAGSVADLYVCTTQVGGPTVIARYSSEGSDYVSGHCFSYGANADLTVARIAAEEAGLLAPR